MRLLLSSLMILVAVGCATGPRRPIDPGTAILLQGYFQRTRPVTPPYVVPQFTPYVPLRPSVYCTPAYDGMGGTVCR